MLAEEEEAGAEVLRSTGVVEEGEEEERWSYLVAVEEELAEVVQEHCWQLGVAAQADCSKEAEEEGLPQVPLVAEVEGARSRSVLRCSSGVVEEEHHP